MGIQIWGIFVKFHYNFSGMMTNDSELGNIFYSTTTLDADI